MLPALFRDGAEMPQNLRRHIRYPEDLFDVQAEMYGTYHMTNPMTFYNREDRWEVPHQLFREREIEMTPYYVMPSFRGRRSRSSCSCCRCRSTARTRWPAGSPGL